MKTKPSANGTWYFIVAAALGATCRSYDTDAPHVSTSGGSSSGGSGGIGSGRGGSGGEAADAGDSGASGEAGAGGGSGNATGGLSGSAGTNESGASGDGTSGEGVGGTGPTPTSEPGILGAVRLLVNGIPKCGGSLLTNDWVLTADQCVPTNDLTALEVRFGMEVERFQQTRGVIEIQRFPGNDGTVQNRGPDLLLLGVELPFELDGRTSGYYRPVWSHSPEAALVPHRCVGWDLNVSEESPTSSLHEESLIPLTFELQTTNGARPSGSRLWWLNGNAGQAPGVLPMQADVGSACFHTIYDSTFQHTVHSGNPPSRRNGKDNLGREAYSVALGERDTSLWLDSVMSDSVVEGVELAGDPGVCSSRVDQIELFGLLPSGEIGWFTWDGTFTERASIDPPSGTTFIGQSPGAYCAKGGGIELFATGLDGEVWWLSVNSSEEWHDQWTPVPDVESAVVSGVAVTGVLNDHFYMFARDASGELRYAEYDAGWKGIWSTLGGTLTGTPAALMSQEGRIDVYARFDNGEIYQRWMYNGNWLPDWTSQGPATSDPTIVSWDNQHLDQLARSASNTLQHSLFHIHWAGTRVTDLPMPPGKPSAVARQPGTTDVFVKRPDGLVWHGFWPRKPR